MHAKDDAADEKCPTRTLLLADLAESLYSLDAAHRLRVAWNSE